MTLAGRDCSFVLFYFDHKKKTHRLNFLICIDHYCRERCRIKLADGSFISVQHKNVHWINAPAVQEENNRTAPITEGVYVAPISAFMEFKQLIGLENNVDLVLENVDWGEYKGHCSKDVLNELLLTLQFQKQQL